jgi:phosphate transport system substrate-binding protein
MNSTDVSSQRSQEQEVNTTSIRRLAATTAVLALGVSLTACGAANETGASSDASNTSADSSNLSGTLSAGGSSAQEAAQSAWRAGFQQAHPDVTVNYDPIGSGGGREQFISGGYPFAGSDAYLSEDGGELAQAKERCGGDVIEIPDYVSPIAVIYNVDGVDSLNLSPDTLAGIFAGDIKTWDDAAIKAENPDASLPSEPINAVHRSDDSGTTENFTDYLSAVSPDGWSYGPVETWPVKGGEGASGTSGVVSAVKNGANSIGYADASQAGDLGVANIKVGDEYVAPSADAAAKILEVSPRVEGRSDSDMAFDLDHETQESGVYPIVLTSYLIACPTYDDQQTADLVKAYLGYVVSDEGQQAAADTAGSAPLAASLAEQARSVVDGIKAG